MRKAGAWALLIAAAGLLSGCETDGSGPGPLAALTQPAKPAEAEGAQQPPKAEPAKTEPAKSEPPMTRARAAAECWMKTEKGRADVNLDQRADVVTKCIDDKMKAAPKS